LGIGTNSTFLYIYISSEKPNALFKKKKKHNTTQNTSNKKEKVTARGRFIEVHANRYGHPKKKNPLYHGHDPRGLPTLPQSL
jgi:hypothetical protein